MSHMPLKDAMQVLKDYLNDLLQPCDDCISVPGCTLDLNVKACIAERFKLVTTKNHQAIRLYDAVVTGSFDNIPSHLMSSIVAPVRLLTKCLCDETLIAADKSGFSVGKNVVPVDDTHHVTILECPKHLCHDMDDPSCKFYVDKFMEVFITHVCDIIYTQCVKESLYILCLYIYIFSVNFESTVNIYTHIPHIIKEILDNVTETDRPTYCVVTDVLLLVGFHDMLSHLGQASEIKYSDLPLTKLGPFVESDDNWKMMRKLRALVRSYCSNDRDDSSLYYEITKWDHPFADAISYRCVTLWPV